MHMGSTNHVQASILLALESALLLFLVLINETRVPTAARLISVLVNLRHDAIAAKQLTFSISERSASVRFEVGCVIRTLLLFSLFCVARTLCASATTMMMMMMITMVRLCAQYVTP